ncbi:hypothetical protein [Modicisalibacter xianhensis]|uniref:Uncharacterized protein n=1 Tax=Modicisalibacter xianhensis TaxID=442341 RepID=A0A1I3FR79_9GAMM|nr:hypothetical protein [Halomonas xianhensis]SFI13709.1 hypothetical protein SAMN04487959_12053 [Halomonas xianhensis]
MKNLYVAGKSPKTPGQAKRAASKAKKADRIEALHGIEAKIQRYKIERPGASLEIIRRVFPDITTVASEFCEAHDIGLETVLPNLSADVIAHVQTYGLSSRDELLGVTTRMIRAYLPRAGC